MNSIQYEELSRIFIAQKVGIDLSEVKSLRIPNPRRPGLSEFKHQIDLCWETGSELAIYLNIANAKWRTKDKIEQGDVLLLQQVRQKVAAHKAFMITSVGFDTGAIAAAKDEGIALHILQPTFDVNKLPARDRNAIQAKLHKLVEQSTDDIWSHHTEHRGLDFPQIAERPSSMPPTTRSTHYETRVVGVPSQRTISPSSNRAIKPGDTSRTSRSFTDRQQGGNIIKK